MAVVKYGAIITEIKGKIGGTIFQAGRSSPIVRGWNPGKNRVDGANNGGDVMLAQQARTDFGRVSKHWATLTNAERLTWAGLLGVWTFTNKFGDVYDGTPYQIFFAVNRNRLILGVAFLNTAPISLAAEDIDQSISDYSLAGVWEAVNTIAPSAPMRVATLFSFPVNPTKNLGSVVMRYVGVGTRVLATTVDLKPFWTAYYGQDPPLGSKIFVQTWFAFDSYPRQQFFQTYSIDVVA